MIISDFLYEFNNFKIDNYLEIPCPCQKVTNFDRQSQANLNFNYFNYEKSSNKQLKKKINRKIFLFD